MFDFKFFTSHFERFKPKTPAAALKGFQEGYLPIETFINKATSTKPLDEEPYDIDEIERVLSRQDLDIKTNIILIKIFQKLIGSPNQEIALFAAESINIIEHRYNKKIEAIKGDGQNSLSPDRLYRLAELYYEQALLNEKRKVIKNFYLREAYRTIHEASKRSKMSKVYLNTLVRILVELNLPYQAGKILDQCENKESLFYLFLKAEVEFTKRNFPRVMEICKKIAREHEKLIPEKLAIIQTWTGA